MTKPLVVVSSARSGTNYFLSVFGAVMPDAIVLREIFRKGGDSLAELSALTGSPEAKLTTLGQRDPVALWQMVRDGAGHAPLALKIFYYHAPVDSPIWRVLAQDACIVHLIRRRLLDTLASRKLALATGRWMAPVQGRAPAAAPALRIEPQEAAAFIKERKNYIEGFRKRFTGADVHEIAYEDIASDPRLCAQAIASVTGHPVPNHPIRVPIRKQNTWPLPDLISNYDEIAAYDTTHL